MRFALRVLQTGAVAVVLAVTTFFAFELDRFFVPKELVLHAAALLAGAFALRRIRRTRLDLFLLGFLLLSTASAVLAQNRWLGLRGLAISASGVVLFWIARSLREHGLARPLSARSRSRSFSSPRRRSCRPMASRPRSSPRIAPPAGPSATATSSPTPPPSDCRCCCTPPSPPADSRDCG